MRLNPYPCYLKVRRVRNLGDALAVTMADGNQITVLLSDEADVQHCAHEAAHVRQAVEAYVDAQLDYESQAYLEQEVFEILRGRLKQ